MTSNIVNPEGLFQSIGLSKNRTFYMKEFKQNELRTKMRFRKNVEEQSEKLLDSSVSNSKKSLQPEYVDIFEDSKSFFNELKLYMEQIGQVISQRSKNAFGDTTIQDKRISQLFDSSQTVMRRAQRELEKIQSLPMPTEVPEQKSKPSKDYKEIDA